ncbi:MAG: molybdopterin-dependent oxidoreductase [Chloroflexi bacterium]|nr:molybdopterin-dependent oxidoreductase [Chloroflexota bacterium]
MHRFTRREILRLTGLSAVGAFVLQACGQYPRTELQVQSPVKMPEDLVTGRDTYYATVCRECPAGCGTMVRVVEGRAIKIEGNPSHPLNRGKICARGLAAVQGLYHPDRLKKPLKRTGERGSGEFTEISWEEATGQVTGRLSQLRAQGQAHTVLLVTAPLSGHAAHVSQQFIRSYGGQQAAYEPLERTTLRAAVKRAFATETLPDFDIASSDYVLSFGADLLSAGLSPVRYGMGYGEFRQGARPRGTLVQIEPRFSLTAANADEWLAVRPGTEGFLALSLAQVIISEGLGDSRAASTLTEGQGERVLADFRPENAATLTGVPAGKIRDLARKFAGPRGGGRASPSQGVRRLRRATDWTMWRLFSC